MKIRTLLLCVLGVLGGGYGLLLGTVYLSTTATHSRISQISSSLFPAALKIEASEAAFEKMKKHYGDAVVLQDAKALSGAESDAEAVAEGLAQVREALAHSPELRGQADALAGQFADLRTRDRETYTALLSNPAGASDELMGRVGDLGKENVALTQSMGALDKAIAQAFQKQLDGVDAWSVRSRLTGLVMLAFIVVSGGFAWWMTQSRIVAPLRMLEGHMGRVAEGDLRERIPVASEDEIGELSRWFNTFLDKMQALIRQVQENTKRLAAACEGISSSSSEMAHGAESQQMQTAQVASAMQEMSATVQEISRNSTAAAEQAHGGAAAAREGGAAMERTIGMMQRVTSSVEDVARQIVELGNRSDQIGRIVGVIDEIAQQTNLLALNAAIESARAGEHGRGFAVVAGEVRRLAERTTSATKEIAAMIGSIQNDTKAAVEAMGRGTEEVEEGVRTAQEAGAKLQGIIHGAEQAAASVAQIATAATEQASTTDEVSGNITEIATISNRVALGASESARSSGELTRLAEELDSLMARFRVEDSDGGAGLQAGIPAGRGEAVLRARAGAAIAV